LNSAYNSIPVDGDMVARDNLLLTQAWCLLLHLQSWVRLRKPRASQIFGGAVSDRSRLFLLNTSQVSNDESWVLARFRFSGGVLVAMRTICLTDIRDSNGYHLRGDLVVKFVLR